LLRQRAANRALAGAAQADQRDERPRALAEARAQPSLGLVQFLPREASKERRRVLRRTALRFREKPARRGPQGAGDVAEPRDGDYHCAGFEIGEESFGYAALVRERAPRQSPLLP